jgi:integrase
MKAFWADRLHVAAIAAAVWQLRWEDVDLKAAELHVRQRADRYNVIGKPKSEAGNRTVPLGPLVLNTLREWKLNHDRQRAHHAPQRHHACTSAAL